MTGRPLAIRAVQKNGRWKARVRLKWYLLEGETQAEAQAWAEEHLRPVLEAERAPKDLSKMTWWEACDHVMSEEHERRCGVLPGKVPHPGWKGYRESLRALKSMTVTIGGVRVSKLSLEQFQTALDAATRVPGRTPGTVGKIQPRVAMVFTRLRHVGIAKSRWDADLVWPKNATTREVKPHAFLTPEELRAYLSSEEATLEMRVATAIAYDVINVRAGDLRSVTWDDLGAPSFEKLRFGNEKLHRKNDRVAHLPGLDPVKVLLRRYYQQEELYWSQQGMERPELAFPARRAPRKGLMQQKSDKWAKKLRKEVARTMGIRLGWEDNAGMGRNSKRPECGRYSEPCPDEWTERQLELFKGSDKFAPLNFHASRTFFNAQLAEVVADPREREAITSQTAGVVERHYRVKQEVDATQRNRVFTERCNNGERGELGVQEEVQEVC